MSDICKDFDGKICDKNWFYFIGLFYRILFYMLFLFYFVFYISVYCETNIIKHSPYTVRFSLMMDQ